MIMLVPDIEKRSTHCQRCRESLDKAGACPDPGCAEGRELQAKMCDRLAADALDRSDQKRAAEQQRKAAWWRIQAGRAAPLLPREQLELRLLQHPPPAEAGFIHQEIAAKWAGANQVLEGAKGIRDFYTLGKAADHLEAFKAGMKRYMQRRKPLTWWLHKDHLAAEFEAEVQRHRDRWENSDLVKSWQNRDRWENS